MNQQDLFPAWLHRLFEPIEQCRNLYIACLMRRWVPKIGRKIIKNREDLDFYDIIRYDPDLLDKPPYRLPISSSFPLLGSKAWRLCIEG